MKAIETRYKGYHFRSRTEARWACFFDELGVKWEYEPEGFDLGEVGRYLPDFRVTYPGWKPVWFEVKGDVSDITTDEWLKMITFGENDQLMLLDGPPEVRPYFEIDGPRSALQEYADGKDDWCFGAQDVLNVIDDGWFDGSDGQMSEYRMGWYLWGTFRRGCGPYLCPLHEDLVKGPTTDELQFIERAVNAARSARFEHGESGPT